MLQQNLKVTDVDGGSDGKESVCNIGDAGDARGLVPGLGRSLGEGNGYPLQHSCLFVCFKYVHLLVYS